MQLPVSTVSESSSPHCISTGGMRQNMVSGLGCSLARLLPRSKGSCGRFTCSCDMHLHVFLAHKRFLGLFESALCEVYRGRPTRGKFEMPARSDMRYAGGPPSGKRKRSPYNGDECGLKFLSCSWRPVISAGSWGSRFREFPTPSGRSGRTGAPAGPSLSLASALMNTKPPELSAPAWRVGFALISLAFLMACRWRICTPVWLQRFTSRKQRAVVAGWKSRHGCPAFSGMQSTTGFPQWVRS